MYGNKYILGFENELNELYEVYFDLLNYTGISIPLFGAENCLTLRSTTGDQNKLAPVLGTECLVKIVVGKVSVNGIEWDNDDIQIDDLIAQHDDDIRVTVYRNQDYTKSIFQGFIVVEDNSQPFLDPPFILSLRALDGLGLLKGVDFKDSTGALFSGTLTPLDWLANMLYKTGQKLNIRVYFNFVNNAFPTLSPITSFFINAITFYKGELQTTTDPSVDLIAVEADDCYTVIEKIVRCLRCRLFQEDGVWNLVNLYEYANPNGYAYSEFTISEPVSGYVMTTLVANAGGKKYGVNVGSDQIIYPVHDDTIRYLKVATKWEKLIYNYDQSLNKICNQNLQGGGINYSYDGIILSNVQDPTSTIRPIFYLTTIGYDAFCYKHLDGAGTLGNRNAYPSNAPTARGYIRKVVDSLGYEIERYLVLENPIGPVTYFRSSQLLIDKGDVFQMSVDWRTRDNIHTPSLAVYDIAWVYLYGDDGTFWALRCVADASIPGNPTQWLSVDSNFQAVSGGSPPIISSSITDTNVWTITSVNQNPTNATIQSSKSPINGRIEVLFQFDKTTGGTEMWFKNIKISIIPFLSGSYKTLKGDYNYSASLSTIKQTQSLSEQVQISDSPKRYFKGALLQPDGKTLMIPSWSRVGYNDNSRFTQLMERIIFNNVYRNVEKIEGTFRGLVYVDETLATKQAGYINSYYFSDHNTPTKKFMLTSYEKNYATGQGRHVFVEVLADQNDTGFVNPNDISIGTYDFQYILQ